MRPAFLAALARPFSRSHSTALSISPSHSTSAFLQSIIPTLVISRRVFTSAAVKAILSSSYKLLVEKGAGTLPCPVRVRGVIAALLGVLGLGGFLDLLAL